MGFESKYNWLQTFENRAQGDGLWFESIEDSLLIGK